MTQVTVYKLDASGNELWRYPAEVLDRQPHCVRLEAFFDRDDMVQLARQGHLPR